MLLKFIAEIKIILHKIRIRQLLRISIKQKLFRVLYQLIFLNMFNYYNQMFYLV